MNSNPNKLNHTDDRLSQWPNLPPDILSLIANRLESEQDIRHIRIVCKSWNSLVLNYAISKKHILSSKSYSNFAYKLTHSLHVKFKELNKSVKNPLAIIPYSVYVLLRTIDDAPWLVGVEQHSSSKPRLFHPLSRALINNYPKLLRDFCPVRVSTGYQVRYSESCCVSKDRGVTKVIHWKNPYKPSNDVEIGSLMVLHNNGYLSCFSSKIGSHLIDIVCRETRVFHDIIMWNNKFVAVDFCGRLFVIEYKSMSVTTILAASSSIYESLSMRKRLFESNGQLYMVVRKQISNSLVVELKVYMLNIVSNQWEKLRSLGDRNLFISKDNCFFVKSSDLFPRQQCFRNHIFFSKGCFDTMMYNLLYSQDEYITHSQDERLFSKDRGHFESVGVHHYNQPPNFRLLSAYSTTLPRVSTVFKPPLWVFELQDESDPFSGKFTDGATKKREGEEKTIESNSWNRKKRRTSQYLQLSEDEC